MTDYENKTITQLTSAFNKEVLKLEKLQEKRRELQAKEDESISNIKNIIEVKNRKSTLAPVAESKPTPTKATATAKAATKSTATAKAATKSTATAKAATKSTAKVATKSTVVAKSTVAVKATGPKLPKKSIIQGILNDNSIVFVKSATAVALMSLIIDNELTDALNSAVSGNTSSGNDTSDSDSTNSKRSDNKDK
jgi:hypothetical protein